MTNYERIKDMTIEKMAEFICNMDACNCCKMRPNDGVMCPSYHIEMCETGVKEYLESEVEE